MVQSAESALAELLDLAGPRGRAPTDGIFDLLRESGGSFEMAVNGTEPVAFEWINPEAAGRDAYLSRMLIAALGATAEDLDGFFSLAALEIGLLIDIRDQNGDVIEAFETDTAPIKRHVEFGQLAGIDVDSDSTANRSRFSIRWTFDKAMGRPVLIPAGASIRVTVRDDLASLAMFRVAVQGYR